MRKLCQAVGPMGKATPLVSTSEPTAPVMVSIRSLPEPELLCSSRYIVDKIGIHRRGWNLSEAIGRRERRIFARAARVKVRLVESPDHRVDKVIARNGEDVGLHDDPVFVEAERRIIDPID